MAGLKVVQNSEAILKLMNVIVERIITDEKKRSSAPSVAALERGPGRLVPPARDRFRKETTQSQPQVTTRSR